MTSPLQTPTLSQHLSWLFIRCKHLSPVSPSALAHALYIFTRVPAHRQVFEQLHLPSPRAPRHNAGYCLFCYSMCCTEGWSLQMLLHRNSITPVTESSQHRPCRGGFISVHTVSSHSQCFLLQSLLCNYRMNTVKSFSKSPQSKTWIFKLAALNSAREGFCS